MKIKPSAMAWLGAGAMILAVGLVGAFCIHAVVMKMYTYLWCCSLPLFLIMLVLMGGSVCLLCKTVELCPEGYWVSFCGVRRLYRWENVKTKRLEDYTRVWSKNFNNARFPEGAIFSIHEKKRPKWLHPALFCGLTHPFSSFYVCFQVFQVETEKSWYEYRYLDDYVVVDKKELLDTLESFGVKLDSQ